MKRTLALIFLFTSLAYAGNRNWQEGTVIRSATSNNGTAAVPIGTAVYALPIRSTLYHINTSDLSIVVNTERALNITLNKKTKVAIEGQKLFIIDDDGKERKLRIVQKEALPAPSPLP
jgi:hypothetical protein